MFFTWKNKKIVLFLSIWNYIRMIGSKRILRGSIEVNIKNIVASSDRIKL